MTEKRSRVDSVIQRPYSVHSASIQRPYSVQKRSREQMRKSESKHRTENAFGRKSER
jgi:hypothetical protein